MADFSLFGDFHRITRTQQRAGPGNPARRRLTVSPALALVHMSLNVPGGNRNHRKGQDHVEGIGRLENHEARLVIPPRFAVVYQRELNRETIDAIVPAST